MSAERTFEDRSTLGADGTVRKAHYGSGEQPWDTMLRLGWGPHFAASCVLRYLRRDKDLEHSLESAKWYHTRIVDHFKDNEWRAVLRQLYDELTEAERARLK